MRAESNLPEAVLFDLDGTLIDSAADIAAATDELLAGHGLAPLGVDTVRGMIGNGVGKLVQRAFAARGISLDAEALEARVAEMMPIYGRHLTNLTVVLPGAEACLSELASAGVKLAIVSNKPMDFTRTIVEHHGWTAFVSAIQGALPQIPKKPAPDMLFAALDAMGCGAAGAVMVGDGAADVEAAHAAGLPAIIVRGGYGAEAPEPQASDLMIDSLFQLSAALAHMKRRSV